MSYAFVIKYDHEQSWKFDGVDAYWGTKSLAAITQVLLLVVHASIHGEVIVQAPSAKGFRVVLGKSREGSWEQFISLTASDPAICIVTKRPGQGRPLRYSQVGLFKLRRDTVYNKKQKSQKENKRAGTRCRGPTGAVKSCRDRRTPSSKKSRTSS